MFGCSLKVILTVEINISVAKNRLPHPSLLTSSFLAKQVQKHDFVDVTAYFTKMQTEIYEQVSLLQFYFKDIKILL